MRVRETEWAWWSQCMRGRGQASCWRRDFFLVGARDGGGTGWSYIHALDRGGSGDVSGCAVRLGASPSICVILLC